MRSVLLLLLGCWSSLSVCGDTLRVASFAVDATPPLGTPLAYDEMTWVDQPLSCRGVVILGKGFPIVLCAVDWIGIANEGQDAFKNTLAEAAGTRPDRVSVHTLHQHDAPVCDITANRLLADHGLNGALADPVFLRRTMVSAATAIQKAIQEAVPLTHIGYGAAEVKQVASNRRILGPDGKVRATRYTTCRDPELRALPAGVVDPMVRIVSFWSESDPVAVISYFATHPQSFYRTGGANPDFPGIARDLRETESGGLFHVHFNGAGGNIGAGKWNDGNKENRLLLGIRLKRGIKEAFETAEKVAISADDIAWTVAQVSLPVGKHLQEDGLAAEMADPDAPLLARKEAARNLAWLQRTEQGIRSELACLSLGPVKILHCPGEMVVEYQLAAQAMLPEGFVCLAAYGDYGPGYICLTEHYAQGGYEASERASRVSPDVEAVLMPAMKRLLVP